jgi:hypothetical protein
LQRLLLEFSARLASREPVPHFGLILFEKNENYTKRGERIRSRTLPDEKMSRITRPSAI